MAADPSRHALASPAGFVVLVLLTALLGTAGCATPEAPGERLQTGPHGSPQPTVTERVPTGTIAARTALSMVGTPYRYGGTTPRGFDCSGLVVYSYRQAGVDRLPRSAAHLERVATPVALDRLQPGDLLFFRLSGKKTSHVGLYVGGRSFVHAPSPGKRVEQVSFDHVYWGPRIRLAGRL